MSASYTPMMEQYLEIKRQHHDEIVFFRLGDFYEMFFSDAELASRELDITLTGRDGGAAERIPMCGVPYHAADNYIARLINKGYRVAICEQVEDPKAIKGLVKREVVKVITPGTFLSDSALSQKGNSFLAVLYGENDSIGMSAIDLTTGECLWAECSGSSRLSQLGDHLFRLSPVELLWANEVPGKAAIASFVTSRLPGCFCSPLPAVDTKEAAELPQRHFAIEDLPDCHTARQAVGYALAYLHYAVKTNIDHINRLVRLDTGEHLILDASSLRNLEITRNLRDGGKHGTLLHVLDYTQTAMGSRLLKNWLEYPLWQSHSILYRQQGVAELTSQPQLRSSLQEQLKAIYDFERIMTRIETGTANARDLSALKASLTVLPSILDILTVTNSAILRRIGRTISPQPDIVAKLELALIDNPPLSVRDGGMIATGYYAELDELRTIAQDSKQWIQNLEASEREKSGIKSLKIGYNKVFGYYIEVTHANSAAVPLNYVRKQTLANAERYITPELKDFEIKVLGAQEKIVALEYQLFCQIRDEIKAFIPDIQETSRQIACLDCLISLSECAFRNQYIQPVISTNKEILIKDGRHPVVEQLLAGEMFVPNDVHLNHHDTEIAVITGPNMAGKSTYMRQVAVLVLMAQTGSFIPAREAVICPVDRIFTRVGASDDLATGQSTFMVEMNEVAHIIKHATSNSLIILDEIGRGTSTFDGMSIARSVIEYIKERIKGKTLFATHYHELTSLADEYPGIRNFTVAVKERGTEVIFLRRIIPGGADKSYGIHVAQLAGLPRKLIERSREVLAELETCHTAIHPAAAQKAAARNEPVQSALTLFTSPLVDEMAQLDVLSLTPIEAMNILWKLHCRAKEESGR